MNRVSLWSLYCFCQLLVNCCGKHSFVLVIELQNAIPLIHVIHQLYKYYCINWSRSVPDQTVEGGSPLTPMVPAHLSIPLITGRGTGTETCRIGSAFPSDDLWIGLDTCTNCTLVYDLILKRLSDGVCHFNLFVLTDGERDGLWWPTTSGHWLFCTGCCKYLRNMKFLMFGLLFLQLSISLGCFHPWTFFSKNDFD